MYANKEAVDFLKQFIDDNLINLMAKEANRYDL